MNKLLRFIAAFLATGLALPSPVLALRPEKPSDSPRLREELRTGLEESGLERMARLLKAAERRSADQPFQICLLCNRNRERSPALELLLRDFLDKRRIEGIQVESAAILPWTKQEIMQEDQKNYIAGLVPAVRQAGISQPLIEELARKKPRKVSEKLLSESGLILVTSRHHPDRLRAKLRDTLPDEEVQQIMDRVVTFGELLGSDHPSLSRDGSLHIISDSGKGEVFLGQMAAALDPLLRQLTALPGIAGLEEPVGLEIPELPDDFPYRVIPLTDVPDFFRSLSREERRRFLNRLVQRGDRHYLVKWRIPSADTLWHDKDDPAREYLFSRLVRALGGDVTDVVIPDLPQRRRLAQVYGVADPDDLYLAELSEDYSTADREAVPQPDADRAFSGDFGIGALLRMYDFGEKNLGLIRGSSTRMMFDGEQSFNPAAGRIDAFALALAVNYWNLDPNPGPEEIQEIDPNRLLSRLRPEELQRLVGTVESFDESVLHRIVEQAPRHLQARMRTLVKPLHGWMKSYRRDLIELLGYFTESPSADLWDPTSISLVPRGPLAITRRQVEQALSRTGLEENGLSAQSRYQPVSLEEVPRFRDRLGDTAPRYARRLVRDKQAPGVVYLIKNEIPAKQTTLGGTREKGWYPFPTKNYAWREYFGARLARDLGANAADLVIPNSREREMLARYAGVEPEGLYLAQLTLSYRSGSPEVVQTDFRKAFTRNLVIAVLLRKIDFHDGNLGSLADTELLMMAFDADLILQEEMADLLRYTPNFIGNYFQLHHRGNRVVLKQLFDRIDLEELRQAVHDVETFPLEDWLERMRQTPGIPWPKIEPLADRLRAHQKSIRDDFQDLMDLLLVNPAVADVQESDRRFVARMQEVLTPPALAGLEEPVLTPEFRNSIRRVILLDHGEGLSGPVLDFMELWPAIWASFPNAELVLDIGAATSLVRPPAGRILHRRDFEGADPWSSESVDPETLVITTGYVDPKFQEGQNGSLLILDSFGSNTTYGQAKILFKNHEETLVHIADSSDERTWVRQRNILKKLGFQVSPEGRPSILSEDQFSDSLRAEITHWRKQLPPTGTARPKPLLVVNPLKAMSGYWSYGTLMNQDAAARWSSLLERIVRELDVRVVINPGPSVWKRNWEYEELMRLQKRLVSLPARRADVVDLEAVGLTEAGPLTLTALLFLAKQTGGALLDIHTATTHLADWMDVPEVVIPLPRDEFRLTLRQRGNRITVPVGRAVSADEAEERVVDALKSLLSSSVPGTVGTGSTRAGVEEQFSGSLKEAMRWIEEKANPEFHMVWLPFAMWDTREGTVQSILPEVKQFHQGGLFPMEKHLAIATLTYWNGARTVTLLVSESSEQVHPEPIEGTSLVFHVVESEVAPFIFREGFFSLPWRFSFYDLGQALEAAHPKSVVLAFRIPNRYLIRQHFQKAKDNSTAMFSIDPSIGIGTKLPDEVREFLKTRLRDGSPKFISPEQVLLSAETGGLLVRIPPSWLDLSETVAVNRGPEKSAGKTDSAAGVEERDFSDRVDPNLGTADEVAAILRERHGVPLRVAEDGRWTMTEGGLPELSWTMNEIRPIERGRIFTELESMPIQRLIYPLKTLPLIGTGEHSSGIYLGLVEGIDHPVVIKMTTLSLGEMVNAQVLGRLGVFPRFLGLIQLADGRRGYVLEAVSGVPISHPDVQRIHPHDYLEIYQRSRDHAGLVPDLTALMRTPADRLINIDAGHAYVLNAKLLEHFIDDLNQNPDGSVPVFEDPVSAAARLIRTRGVDSYWVILDVASAQQIHLLFPLVRELESTQELRGRVFLLGELEVKGPPLFPHDSTLQMLSDRLAATPEFHRPDQVMFIGPAEQAKAVSAIVKETLGAPVFHLPPSLVNFLIGLGVPDDFAEQMGSGLEEASALGWQL